MLSREKGINLKRNYDKSIKKMKLVAEGSCANDDAAVAALPEQWVPRRSGSMLTKYLKEREKTHEKILAEMNDSASKINNGINSELQIIAEILLAHIQKNQVDINSVVVQFSTGIIPLSTEARNDALKQVNHFYFTREEDIVTFHREALVLERRRADGLRELLREHFQRLVSIGHMPPKDLLHDFDQRIYEINQQLLSNSRAYVELEALLRAQTDENIIRTRSSLNQFCFGITKINRRYSALLSPLEEKQIIQRPTTASVQIYESSLPLIEKIMKDACEIDIYVARMLEAYQNAVMKVFGGFSGKLQELHKRLGCYDYIERQPLVLEITDLHQIIEKELCKLSSYIFNKTITNEVMEIARDDNISMHRSLCSLGDSLRDTYIILHDVGHLWDVHMLRSGLVQKLTIAAVEDLLTSNDAVQLSNEVSFNVTLEQLRSISDHDKLKELYDTSVLMLERTADMYMHHNETELKRLEEFMKFSSSMATTLISEFHCFLEKHPKISVQSIGSATSQRSMSSARYTPSNIIKPLSRAIFQTELQLQSLKNWRNGFLESFESNVAAVPDEISHQAHLWIEEKAVSLHTRYTSKMVSHSIRSERLKAARDMRLAELRQHESRLDSHLGAIYDLVNSLPTVASQYLTLDSPELYPFCKWIDSLQININKLLTCDNPDPETKRLKMISYAARLTKHRKLFEESLYLAIEACKQQAEYRVQEARISNVRFLSQIKLFSEGGLYSAQEAMRASTSLMKGADALELCMSRTIDALNHRRSQLLNLADHRLLPLQKMVDDVVKIGKRVQDKCKVPPGKKK